MKIFNNIIFLTIACLADFKGANGSGGFPFDLNIALRPDGEQIEDEPENVCTDPFREVLLNHVEIDFLDQSIYLGYLSGGKEYVPLASWMESDLEINDHSPMVFLRVQRRHHNQLKHFETGGCGLCRGSKISLPHNQPNRPEYAVINIQGNYFVAEGFTEDAPLIKACWYVTNMNRMYLRMPGGSMYSSSLQPHAAPTTTHIGKPPSQAGSSSYTPEF